MRKTIDELRHQTSSATTSLRGMIRRVAIGVARADRLLQLLGYDAGGGREVFDKIRNFQGIGFSSRPRAGKGEAILVKVGAAAAHLVAIATRDLSSEPTDLDEDESQLHNSTAQVRVTKAGKVEVTDRAGGAAVALATKADLDALRAVLSNWTPAPTDGGAALKTALQTAGLIDPTGPAPTPVASWPAGTSVLKGQ